MLMRRHCVVSHAMHETVVERLASRVRLFFSREVTIAWCMAEGSRSSSWACILLRSEGPGYSTGCGEWCSCSATSPPCADQITAAGLSGSWLICSACRPCCCHSKSLRPDADPRKPLLNVLNASQALRCPERHHLFTSARACKAKDGISGLLKAPNVHTSSRSRVLELKLGDGAALARTQSLPCSSCVEISKRSQDLPTRSATVGHGHTAHAGPAYCHSKFAVLAGSGRTWNARVASSAPMPMSLQHRGGNGHSAFAT